MSERFWLITEPARGLSIKVPVPDSMLPSEALEHFAAREGYNIGEAYIKWRRESEMTSLESFLADETDDAITLHEETREAAIDPAAKPPGELFAAWRATKMRVEDLGEALSDEMLTGIPGWTYGPGGFYIEDHAGRDDLPPNLEGQRFHLLIEREEWWSNDYDELEHRLFFTWALPEGFTS